MRKLTSLQPRSERPICLDAETVSAPAEGESRAILHGVQLTAQAGGQDVQPPTRLLVVPWGTHSTPDGTFICDAETAAILPRRQREARADRVPIDFDHSAAFGKNRGEPRHIAGYGTPVVVEGEGIWLTDIRWTPEGRKYWANYEDLSPAFLQDKRTGRVTFLDSVALTPRGQIEGLTLFSAESAESAEAPKEPTKTRAMNLDKLRKFLTAAGVTYADDANAETLMDLAEETLEKMAERSAETKQAATAEEPKPAGETERLARLEAEIQALKEATTAAASVAEEARKQEIIRAASAAGKLLPPEEVIRNMSAEDLQKTADAAPAGMVPGREGSSSAAFRKGTDGAVALSAEDREVARIMGISEEQMKKFAAFGPPPVREF